jgi:shikimate dehydrogenase
MINARTQLLLLLGHPVAQTVTPGFLNPIFQATGVNMAIVPMDLPPAQFVEGLSLIRHAPNIHGALLTVPHKLPAFQYIDKPSARSSALKLVNVVRRDPVSRLLIGDALDGQGFCGALSAHGLSIRDRRLLIVGCGGAGGASAWDALTQGAAVVALMDVQPERVQMLYEILAQHFGAKRVCCVAQAAGEWDVVLNTSPVGMHAQDPLPTPLEGLPAHVVLVDAITPVQPSRWLSLGQKRGYRTVNGHQFTASQMLAIARFFELPESVIEHLTAAHSS